MTRTKDTLMSSDDIAPKHSARDKNYRAGGKIKDSSLQPVVDSLRLSASLRGTASRKEQVCFIRQTPKDDPTSVRYWTELCFQRNSEYLQPAGLCSARQENGHPRRGQLERLHSRSAEPSLAAVRAVSASP